MTVRSAATTPIRVLPGALLLLLLAAPLAAAEPVVTKLVPPDPGSGDLFGAAEARTAGR